MWGRSGEAQQPPEALLKCHLLVEARCFKLQPSLALHVRAPTQPLSLLGCVCIDMVFPYFEFLLLQ